MREIAPCDSGFLYRLRMHPRTRPKFRNPRRASYEVHRAVMGKYFRRVSQDRWFIIEVDGNPVGTIALYDFTNDGHTCEWGRFVIAPVSRRAGYGRRALTLLMRLAARTGVRTMRCEVLSTNVRAARLYRSVGFVRSAVRRATDGRIFVELTADIGGLR